MNRTMALEEIVTLPKDKLVDLIIQYSEVYSFAIIEKDGWINEYERLILLLRREKEDSVFEPVLSLKGDTDSLRLENDVYSQLGVYTQNEREKNEELLRSKQALIDRLQSTMCEIEGVNSNQALLIEELQSKLHKQSSEFLIEKERMEAEIRELKQKLELGKENEDRFASELKMLRELSLMKGESKHLESTVENLRRTTVETVSETRMRWEECSGDRLVEELKEIIRSRELAWSALEARLKYCTCEMGETEKEAGKGEGTDPLAYNWLEGSHEDGALYLRASIVHLKDEIRRLSEELWNSQNRLIGQMEQESSAHKTIAGLEEEIARGKQRIASLEAEREFVESESKKLIEELTQEFIESENTSMASSVVIQQLNSKIAELEKGYKNYVENCWCKGAAEDRSSRLFKSTTVVQEEVIYQGDLSQRTEEKLVAATPLKEDEKNEGANFEKKTWQLNRSKSIVTSGKKEDIVVELSEADILEQKKQAKVSPAPSKIVYKDSKILSQISAASSKTDKSKSKIQRMNTGQAKTPVKGTINAKGSKDLDEIKKVLFEKKSMIEDLDSKVFELSKMTKEIDEKNRLIEGLFSENSKKDQLITELKKAILEKKVDLTKKEGNLIDLRKQIIDRETDMKSLKRDLEARSKEQLELKRIRMEKLEVEESSKERDKLIAKEREYNQEMFKIKEVSMYELKGRIETLEGIIAKLRGDRDREAKEERARCDDLIQKKEAILRACEADKVKLQEKLKEAADMHEGLINSLKELEGQKKLVEDKWRMAELDRIKMREQLASRDRRIIELENLIEKLKRESEEGKLSRNEGSELLRTKCKELDTSAMRIEELQQKIGSLIENVANFEAVQNELKKTKFLLDEITIELSSYKEVLEAEKVVNAELRQRLEAKEKALVEVGQRIEELREVNVDKEKKRVELKEENDRLVERIKVLEREAKERGRSAARDEGKEENKEKERLEKEQMMRGLKEENLMLRKAVEEKDSIIDERDSQLSAKNVQYSESHQTLLIKITELSIRDEEITRLQKLLADKSDLIKSLSDKESSLMLISADLERALQANLSLQADLDASNRNLTALEAKICDLENALLKTEEALRLTRTELEAANKKVSEKDELVSARDSRILSLEAELTDQLKSIADKDLTIADRDQQLIALQAELKRRLGEKDSIIDERDSQLSAKNVQYSESHQTLLIKITELSIRDEEITRLQKLLADKSDLIKSLSDKESSLMLISADLERALQANLSLQADLDASNRNLTALEAKICDLENALLKTEEALRLTRTELEAANKKVSEKDELVSARDSRILSLEAELTDQLKSIADKDLTIADRDQQLIALQAELKRRLGEKDSIIDERDSQLSAKNVQYSESHQTLLIKITELSIRDEEITRLQKLLADKSDLIKSLSDKESSLMLISADLERALQANLSLQADLDASNRNLTALEAKICDLENALLKTEEALRLTRTELEAANKKVSEKDELVSARDSRILSLEAELTDQLKSIADKDLTIADRDQQLIALQAELKRRLGEKDSIIDERDSQLSAKNVQYSESHQTLLIKITELSIRDEEITRLQKLLADKSDLIKSLSDKESSLMLISADLERALQANLSLQADLDASNRNLTALEAKICDLENALLKTEEALRLTRTELEAANKKVSEKDELVSARDSRILSLEAELTDQLKSIADKDLTIADRDQQLIALQAELKRRLGEKDSIIDERDSQLSAKNVQYSESHQTLLIKITELSIRDEEITRLQKLLADKSDLIKSLSDKESSLMLISADLERALQANLSLQADLDASNRNLTALEAKICDLENALLKTEEALRLTRTELEAANKKVSEKDELVSARDSRILSLEAELTDQLKSIADKDLTIADRDQQLIALQAELKRRLGEKDSIIDERDSQLSAKNVQYSESHQTLLIKITELSIRDEEITRLQKLLADKSDLIKSLSDKESSLMLISADLERALQANLSLQADLDASNRNLTALEAKICDLENALLKTEEALRLTRTELEAANKKVSEKDELVSARDSRILSLEAELTDQLKSIADKDLTIADRDQQLIALQAELKRRLGEKDSIIDERDSQLSAKNVQYSESHQTLLIKITELSIRDEEITRLQKLLADKSDLIKSLSDKESSLMLISADLERALQANLSLQADLDASNRNLTALEAKICDLENALLKTEEALRLTRTELEAANKKVSEKDELVSARDSRILSLEAELTDQLKSIADKDLTIADRDQQLIALQAELKRRLGEKDSIIDERDSQLSAKNVQYSESHQTLLIKITELSIRDEEITRLQKLLADKSDLIKSLSDKESSLMLISADLERALQANLSLQADLDASNRNLTALEAKICDLENALLKTEEALRLTRTELEAANKKVSEKDELVSARDSRILSLEAELTDQLKSIADKDLTIADRDQQLIALQAELKRRLGEKDSIIDERDSQLSAKNVQYSESHQTLLIKITELSIRDEEITRLQKLLADKSDLIKSLSDKESSLMLISADLERALQANLSLQADLDASNRNLTALEAKICDLENALLKTEEALRLTRTELEAANKKVSEKDELVSARDSRILSLEAELTDQLKSIADKDLTIADRDQQLIALQAELKRRLGEKDSIIDERDSQLSAKNVQYSESHQTLLIKITELSIRDEEITRLQKLLADKSDLIKSLSDKESSLMLISADLERALQANLSLQADLDASNRNLTALEAKICDLENALLKTEEALRLTRTELEAANKKVSEKDELVSARDSRILSLEAELTDQLKSIADKDLTIADRDQQLIALQAELKRRLGEKDSIIDERDSQLSAKNVQYSESHQTLLIKITELSIRDEEITRLQKLLADKSDLIKSLSDKESSLMLISADLERALQANLSLQADLDASNRNLTALEAKICDLENALLKTEEALRLTRTELEAANKKVSEKDELVSARDSRILSLEAELTDQLKSIADKDLTIADRDQQLIALQAELKRRLGEKDSIIDERDSQLSAKNVQYSESHQTLLIKITELSIRDEEITRLQKLLADKSDLIKSLSDKESSLMLISADLERALQANLSLQADLDASNRNLTALEAKICDLENALLKTEEALRLTRTELEAANKKVSEKDELVSARDSRILSLEAELTDQLKSIADKDLTIADRDQQLIALQAELKRRLGEKDSIIDERDSQLSAKNVQYSESHQTLLIKITELSIRDEEITRLQKLLADKSDLIKSLSDKESSLMLISADLERALQANLSLQADLDASNRNLTALEAKICDLENALLKTEEALRLTRTELEAANKKVSEKDELVSARDSRILSLEAELTDQLKSIADKDLTIADRDQQLIALQAELKRRLGEKDSIIDERDSQLSAKNVQYSESHQTLLIKITELSIRDEEITRLQKLLADKSDLIKSLSDKESSLMLISADLERALQANLSLQADLDASNRNLTALEAKICDLENALLKTEEALRLTRTELEAANKKVSEKDELVSVRDSRILSLEAELTDQLKSIADKDLTIADRDQQLIALQAELKRRLGEKDSIIDERDSQLSAKNVQYSESHQTLLIKITELSIRDEEITRLQKLLVSLHSKCDDFSSQIHSLSVDNFNLSKDLSDLRISSTSLGQQLSSSNELIDLLEKKLLSLETKIFHLRSLNDELKKALANQTSQNGPNEELSRLYHQLLALQESFIKSFEDYHTDAISISKDKLTLADQIALKKFQIARIQKEIDSRPELFHSLSLSLTKEEDDLDKLKQTVRDCEEEIEMTQDKMVFLKKNISGENPQNMENLSELQECENLLLKKQKQILNTFQNLSDKENEMFYLRKQAMNTASAKDEIIRGINDDISTKEERIARIGVELKEKEASLADKKEKLLELEHAIREHVEQIKRLRGDADSVDISRNPFLNLGKQEKSYDAIMPLLEDAQANLLVKTDELNLASYSMQKQQEEILSLKKVIGEGEESRQKLLVQIGLLNEQVMIVKDLQKMIDKLRNELEEKKGVVENLEQRGQDLAKELEDTRNRLYQVTGNESSLKAIQGRSQETISELENELKKKTGEILDVKSRLHKVQGANDDRLKLMEMIGEQERVVTRLTVSLRKEEERADGLRSEQDRISLKLMDQERINEALQREKSRVIDDLGRLKEDHARTTEQNGQLNQELARVTRLLNQKNEDLKDAKEILSQLQNSKELSLTVRDRDRLRDEHTLLLGRFEELQRILNEGKREKEVSQEEIKDLRKENELLKLKVMIQEKEVRRLEGVSKNHELALEGKLREVTEHLNHIRLLNEEIERLTVSHDQMKKSMGLELVEKEEIIKSLWAEKGSKASQPRLDESREATRLGDIIQKAKDQIQSTEKYLNESASNNDVTKGFVQNLLSHMKGLLSGKKTLDLPPVIPKKKQKFNDELINYQDFLGGIEDATEEVVPAKIAFLDQSFDPNNEVRNLRSEIEKKDEYITQLEEDIEVLRQTDIFNTELIKEQERSLASQIEQTLALKDKMKKPLVPYPESAPTGTLTDKHDTSEDYFIVGRTDKKANPTVVSASKEEEEKSSDTQNLGFSFDNLKNQEDKDLMEKFLEELEELKRENAQLRNLIRTRNEDLKEMIGRNIVEKPSPRNQELEQEILRLRSELKQLRRQAQSVGRPSTLSENSPGKELEPTKETGNQAIDKKSDSRFDPKRREREGTQTEDNRLEQLLAEANLLLDSCKEEMKAKTPNLNKNLISKLRQLRDTAGYSILLLGGGSGTGRLSSTDESLGVSYNSLYNDRLQRGANSKSSEKKQPNKDEKPSKESIQRAMVHDTEEFLKDVREVYSDILIYLQKTSNLIEGYWKLDQTTEKICNYLSLKSKNSEAHQRIAELLGESQISRMYSEEEKIIATEVTTRKNIMIELNKLTHYVKKDYKEKQQMINERRLRLSELTKKYSLLESPPSN